MGGDDIAGGLVLRKGLEAQPEGRVRPEEMPKQQSPSRNDDEDHYTQTAAATRACEHWCDQNRVNPWGDDSSDARSPFHRRLFSSSVLLPSIPHPSPRWSRCALRPPHRRQPLRMSRSWSCSHAARRRRAPSSRRRSSSTTTPAPRRRSTRRSRWTSRSSEVQVCLGSFVPRKRTRSTTARRSAHHTNMPSESNGSFPLVRVAFESRR